MIKIIEEFNNLLIRKDSTEQNCQDFLEQNSELIYTPFLLNHHLHLNSIISKFPLDTSLITDFVYLTKSSDFWYIVLVELENPHFKIFNSNLSKPTYSANMNKALAQIYSWQEFISKNKNEVVRRLNPLLTPLKSNPIFFKYLLVIGQGEQKKGSQAMRDRLASRYTQEDILICTYNSLISNYEHSFVFKKNILTLEQTYFKIKHLHQEKTRLFAYLLPESLKISPEQKEILIRHGYDIEAWHKGELLSYNEKMTFEKMKSVYAPE